MRTRALIMVGLLVACAVFQAGCGSGTPETKTAVAPQAATSVSQSASCGPAKPHPSGGSTETMMAGGRQRTYGVYVPASYRGAEAVPLVVMLHGSNTQVAPAVRESELPAKAEQAGFI